MAMVGFDTPQELPPPTRFQVDSISFLADNDFSWLQSFQRYIFIQRHADTTHKSKKYAQPYARD
jgi:hypothetical protein